MPIRDNREYRSAASLAARQEDEQQTFIVEGYATTFNEPYVLMNVDGVDYSEQVDARAFDDADTSDVIMQYDHNGMVFARTRNNTLQLACDDHGLKIRADLSKTTASRELYEAIACGNIDRMSFAFTVDEDDFDVKQHLRTIRKIGKLFDISAVSLPANPGTEIGVATRSLFDGYVEQERQDLAKQEARKAQIIRINMLLGVKEDGNE